MTIDCEMDLNVTNLGKEEADKLSGFTSKNPGLVLKVSMVNMQGETVLDTLVDYSRYIVFKKTQEETPAVEVILKEPEPQAAVTTKPNKKKDKQPFRGALLDITENG
jgi:hypothetical protein